MERFKITSFTKTKRGGNEDLFSGYVEYLHNGVVHCYGVSQWHDETQWYADSLLIGGLPSFMHGEGARIGMNKKVNGDATAIDILDMLRFKAEQLPPNAIIEYPTTEDVERNTLRVSNRDEMVKAVVLAKNSEKITDINLAGTKFSVEILPSHLTKSGTNKRTTKAANQIKRSPQYLWR